MMRHKNRLATNKTVRAMAAGGRLEGVDEGLVGLAQTTADLFDAALADPDEPTYARAAVGRLHLAALTALVGKEEASADAGIAEIIGALSTPLGYATDQPAEPRPSGGALG
jgi:hypothetical protein